MKSSENTENKAENVPPEGAVEPSGENQFLKLLPGGNVEDHSFIFFRPRR